MYRLADPDMWAKLDAWFGADRAGCYRLHACNAEGGTMPLPRLLSTDLDGVLYIGTSKDVPNRVASLKKAIGAAYGVEHKKGMTYRNPGEHGAGWKVSQVAALRSHFPHANLFVTVERCVVLREDNQPAHFEQEAEQIKAYKERHGETPPLNG